MFEVGVYGNLFFRSWKEPKVLATKNTWYYNLWELCNRLGVKPELGGIYHIKPIRQGDCPNIDVTLEMGQRGKILKNMNVVWKHTLS